MADTITVTLGWMDPTTEEEFTVRCRVTPGTPRPASFGPGSTWVPGDDEAQVDVLSVVSDVTGLASPELAVDLEEDQEFRAEAIETAIDRDRSAREDAEEARAEAAREDRRLGS
jgi:hypothetical protein